jgi:hypothetical protein
MLLLSLLFVKHWFVDFVLQTDDMVKSKGIYGSAHGILHSLQHALFTLCLLLLATSPLLAVILATFDGLVHYHVDWLKMNYGCRDITKKEFWNHLGLDQLAHALTYILIIEVLL